MQKNVIYKYGLFGRCPKCKEISQIVCDNCGAVSNFSYGSSSDIIKCQSCDTEIRTTCKNPDCKNNNLILKTPKNRDEWERVLEYIKRNKAQTKNRRKYEIKDDVKDEFSYKNIENAIKTASLLPQTPKESTERRVVNLFFDEQNSELLDKKLYFEKHYDQKVFYDCNSCGTIEEAIVCEKCGNDDQFFLGYHSLKCKCGNEITSIKCNTCGIAHSFKTFYYISNSIKWKYIAERSYYNYRKGRMLVFSTCPSCGIFSIEQCKSCGSKINFGQPNKNNEVYCKNCGTVNQFSCSNKKCNDAVKILQNPDSTSEKLQLLNRAVNLNQEFNDMVLNDADDTGELDIKLTGSFIEKMKSNNKANISKSFLTDVQNSFSDLEEVEEGVKHHNYNKQKSHEIKKQKLDISENIDYASFKTKSKFIFILVAFIIISLISYFGYMILHVK